VLLRFGADDLGWAARYLVTLDCRFTVRQPKELPGMLTRLARELAEDVLQSLDSGGATGPAPSV
jgi:hypothetical protein